MADLGSLRPTGRPRHWAMHDSTIHFSLALGLITSIVMHHEWWTYEKTVFYIAGLLGGAFGFGVVAFFPVALFDILLRNVAAKFNCNWLIKVPVILAAVCIVSLLIWDTAKFYMPESEADRDSMQQELKYGCLKTASENRAWAASTEDQRNAYCACVANEVVNTLTVHEIKASDADPELLKRLAQTCGSSGELSYK